MPTAGFHFKELIQGAQDYGSDGKHLAPRLWFEVE